MNDLVIEPQSDWLRDHHANLTEAQKAELQALREWLHEKSGPDGVAAREPTAQGSDRRH